MTQPSRHKWAKYVFMKQFASLAPYLPETNVFSYGTLWEMVDKYGHAIVKPVSGSRGRGVIQITDVGSEGYELRFENQRALASSKESVYSFIHGITGSNPYLVQWRVPRATIDGRPFDLRVVVQRRRSSRQWVVTGKLAKVAGKGYIVSNITRSNGQVLPVNAAIRRSTIKPKEAVIDRIHSASLLAAEKLGLLYEKHRVFGMDVGIDREGRVWIIEANLYPSMSHFQKLGNRKMIQRIRAFKRS